MKLKVISWRVAFNQRYGDYVIGKDEKHRAEAPSVIACNPNRIESVGCTQLFREFTNEKRGRVRAPKHIAFHELTARPTTSTEFANEN